ncbi:hypothetical protein TNCV_4987441 [Trichonephila clavipes]|nr:hypothetical protein TNCV_4987441 [Trichonephila clavipes]
MRCFPFVTKIYFRRSSDFFFRRYIQALFVFEPESTRLQPEGAIRRAASDSLPSGKEARAGVGGPYQAGLSRGMTRVWRGVLLSVSTEEEGPPFAKSIHHRYLPRRCINHITRLRMCVREKYKYKKSPSLRAPVLEAKKQTKEKLLPIIEWVGEGERAVAEQKQTPRESTN